jgi:DNA-binding PadR family transcriptional regulator
MGLIFRVIPGSKHVCLCRKQPAAEIDFTFFGLDNPGCLHYYIAVRYIATRYNVENTMNLADFGRFSDPALLILSSLADGPKHGYGMMTDIESLAGVRLGPGTLYGALARLESAGLIKALAAEDRRRPYQLTAKGAAALREQLTILQKLSSTGLKRLAAQ